jgi:hypothetical protein
MFNLTSESLSAQRNTYAAKLLESLVNTVAQELVDGTTGREVALPALCKIIVAVMPNTGKGHADHVKAQVTDAVDQAIEAINSAVQDDTTAPVDTDKPVKEKAA